MEYLILVFKMGDNESNLNHEEKKLLLKDYNHRINNDLQALLAFIKLQRRFGIDKDEIINSSCVTVASISAIQNIMYNTEHEENFISINEFCEEFMRILNEYYSEFNIGFSYEIENDFYIRSKKVFHFMFLINEMINLSLDFSFKENDEKKINFNLEKNGEECSLIYSDNGSGFKESLKESDFRNLLFDQLVKQIDGNIESSDNNSIVSINFSSK